MGKPHKHAEILRALADGKKIEWKSPISNFWDDFDSGCFSLLSSASACEFRLKPERDYPKSNMSLDEMLNILAKHKGEHIALIEIANTAVARYIDDQEGKE